MEGSGVPQALPRSLLLPFDEITEIRWDPASRRGRVEAARYNRPDDWFYACHFLGDPVMPGCWEIDALWQCLKFFAAWSGIEGCGKTLGMEGVSFFGQIRPSDKVIRYAVDVVSIETSGEGTLLAGRGAVEADGEAVCSVSKAQIGSDFWQADEASAPVIGSRRESSLKERIGYGDFLARGRLSRDEILAISQGTLLRDAPAEFGLLPSSLMLEIGEVHEISYEESSGEGRIVASRRIDAADWFYPMNGGVKPTALAVDAVWQLLGLFLAWRGNAGTGRALGFERVDVFGEAVPGDRELIYDVRVSKTAPEGARGDAFACADARVFADGRLILSCVNARVGCRRGIRYSDYPLQSRMSFGGALKSNEEGAIP